MYDNLENNLSDSRCHCYQLQDSNLLGIKLLCGLCAVSNILEYCTCAEPALGVSRTSGSILPLFSRREFLYIHSRAGIAPNFTIHSFISHNFTICCWSSIVKNCYICISSLREKNDILYPQFQLNITQIIFKGSRHCQQGQMLLVSLWVSVLGSP